MEKKKQGNTATFTDFCAILYPEDLRFNQLKFEIWLQESMLDGCLSPLHQPDKEEDGQKKEHFHLFVRFRGRRKIESVYKLFEPIFKDSEKSHIHLFQECLNRFNYIPYMLHYGYPDKEQFEPQVMYNFGVFNYRDYLILPHEIPQILIEIINKHNITNYRWLINYLLQEDYPYPVVDFAIKKAYMLNNYLY